MARPIRNHGGYSDIVYDPFLGTGTTIIAAERLGRRCLGMEVVPAYCDISLRRWAGLTGLDPIRADGTRLSELEKEKAEPFQEGSAQWSCEIGYTLASALRPAGVIL